MVDKTTFTVNAANLTMRIQQAEMYLKEFENEVKRANGASESSDQRKTLCHAS